MQLHTSPIPTSRPAKPTPKPPKTPDPEPVAKVETPEAGADATSQPPENSAITTNLHITVPRRFQTEGRWKEIARVRDEMMREALAKMDKAAARAWCYAELDRLYPPIELPKLPEEQVDEAANDSKSLGNGSGDATNACGPTSTGEQPGGQVDARAQSIAGTERVTQCQPSAGVQGLGDVPAEWPPMPSNASLAAEIGWVQANRLAVVEERPGGSTIVRLDRARDPAPSWAAIGWLETSIRSYAKFVDVASKCMGAETDEASQVRRERMAIEEIDQLLAEMHSDH